MKGLGASLQRSIEYLFDDPVAHDARPFLNREAKAWIQPTLLVLGHEKPDIGTCRFTRRQRLSTYVLVRGVVQGARKPEVVIGTIAGGGRTFSAALRRAQERDLRYEIGRPDGDCHGDVCILRDQQTPRQNEPCDSGISRRSLEGPGDRSARALELSACSMAARRLAFVMGPLRDCNDSTDNIQRAEDQLVVPGKPLWKIDVEVRSSIRRVLGSDLRQRATP
jgi:hypothetical protein